MLTVGTRLGPYEIQALLGAGGMGEVYKARDTRLDRIVAIKVLPAHLADNPELRERFEREARTIASLNHPHICTLYDIGRQDGIDFLVMEYLEGETLAMSLLKGPLPLEQVLRYAIEISDALDKAHRKSVTHRDVKPGNIMLTKNGSKLLDFGLAKLKQEAAPVATPLSQLPTLAQNPTVQGTILGTMQYMAPEQLEGKVDELDGRTDIFAFGAVMYEMATGRKAFQGKSSASLIGAIMSSEPPPISSLQPMTPPSLDHVVKRCLVKEPDERCQSAKDLTDELKWIAECGSQAGMPAPVVAHRRTRERLAWAAAAVFFFVSTVALSLWVVSLRRPPAEPQAVRFSVGPPERARFSPNPGFLTVSPDGSKLAFEATDSAGKAQLWIRPLDSEAAQPLPGTENPGQHFWSPDNRFLVFSTTDGKLKKIAVSGGPAQTLADAPQATGAGSAANATWNREGVVLFTKDNTIHRVSAAGGAVSPVTTLDSSRQENGHYWPHFLPDGNHFLYFARSTDPENNAIYAASLNSPEKELLLKTMSNVAYVPPGYLIFNREGTLMAQQFDVGRMGLSGDAVPIAEDVDFNSATGRTGFSVSGNGVLAYRTGGVQNVQLTWTDRAGRKLGPVGELGGHRQIGLSPDEKRVVVERRDPQTRGYDLWLLELSRGIFSRLTSDPGSEVDPVWSPDGRQIVSLSDRKGKRDLYRLDLSSGQEELLLESGELNYPDDWSRDGQFVVYHSLAGGAGIWLLPVFGDRKPKLILGTPFRKDEAQISPDGRWLAYMSDESGSWEVYVQPLQAPGEKLRLSTNGGGQPRWRKDGRELFYLAFDGTMMAVPITAGATLSPGIPESLFQTGITVNPVLDQFAVTGDGQRFLLAVPLEFAPPITVVLNWTALLKK